MILDWVDKTSLFVLRVPRKGNDIRVLMRDHGLDMSLPGSTPDTAMLFTGDPYAACSFWDCATAAARDQLGPIKTAINTSWCATSSRHARVPADMQLWPFQAASLDYCLSRRNTLVADQPGLGKTATAIAFCNEVRAKRVLVLCPANIRLQWVKRIREWTTMPWPYGIHCILTSRSGVHPTAAWTVTSYEMARQPAIAKALAKGSYDALILDECFPGETPVATEHGPMRIKDIVDGRRAVRVWSRSPAGRLELRQVTRFVRTLAPAAMMRIRHSFGTLECTPNHQIYVEDSANGTTQKIPAKDIRPGQTLRILQDPVLREDVLRPILRTKLFGQVAIPASAKDPGPHGEDAGRAKVWPPARCLGQDAEVEFRSGVSRQTGRYIEVAQRPVMAREERGQWLSYDASDPSEFGDRLAGGSCDRDRASEGALREPAELLQGGSGALHPEDRGRGGWLQSSDKEVALLGCTQDRSLGSTRVDGVEVYERGSAGEPWVYNLEVESNHNYFAAGILVGNCHYLKSIDSLRTRSIFGGGDDRAWEPLASRCERILALSGTPLPNRPREIYTVARSLCFDAIDWASEETFKERYNPSAVREVVDKYGRVKRFIDERTGRHFELQNRLRANFMVRHLKADVLTQLPEVMHDIVQMEETGPVKQALKAESMLAIDPETLTAADMSVMGHISVVRHQMGVALAPQAADYVDGLLDGGLDKVLVFAHHLSVLDILQGKLGKHGLVRIDGSSSTNARTKAVKDFREDPDVRVMIGNLQSMGTGTDGLQDVCSHLVFAECSWVHGENQQGIDRLHRMGQDTGVLAEFLVAPGSISEKILANSLRKGQSVHKALDAAL